MSQRLTVSSFQERQRAGEAPLLVCAYDDEEKCQKLRLQGALTLGELEQRKPQLERDRLIVFYCS